MTDKPLLRVPDKIKPFISRALQGKQLVHAGLMFYRYLDGYVGSEENRGNQLQYIVEHASFDTLNDYYNRHKDLLHNLSKQGYAVASQEARLNSRMASGLGIASPFENGISLHRIHGFPYIPGSTLKGISQEYASQYKGTLKFDAVFGEQKPDEDEGGQVYSGHKGSVIFFDAFPLIGGKLLDVDIMTPHYEEYYQDKKPPADYLSPNPIAFLTVSHNTKFLFSLAAKEYTNEKGKTIRGANDILYDAKNWLKGGLETLGVGGKTAIGYGRFRDFKDVTYK